MNKEHLLEEVIKLKTDALSKVKDEKDNIILHKKKLRTDMVQLMDELEYTTLKQHRLDALYITLHNDLTDTKTLLIQPTK